MEFTWQIVKLEGTTDKCHNPRDYRRCWFLDFLHPIICLFSRNLWNDHKKKIVKMSRFNELWIPLKVVMWWIESHHAWSEVSGWSLRIKKIIEGRFFFVFWISFMWREPELIGIQYKYGTLKWKTKRKMSKYNESVHACTALCIKGEWLTNSRALVFFFFFSFF